MSNCIYNSIHQQSYYDFFPFILINKEIIMSHAIKVLIFYRLECNNINRYKNMFSYSRLLLAENVRCDYELMRSNA